MLYENNGYTINGEADKDKNNKIEFNENWTEIPLENPPPKNKRKVKQQVKKKQIDMANIVKTAREAMLNAAGPFVTINRFVGVYKDDKLVGGALKSLGGFLRKMLDFLEYLDRKQAFPKFSDINESDGDHNVMPSYMLEVWLLANYKNYASECRNNLRKFPAALKDLAVWRAKNVATFGAVATMGTAVVFFMLALFLSLAVIVAFVTSPYSLTGLYWLLGALGGSAMLGCGSTVLCGLGSFGGARITQLFTTSDPELQYSELGAALNDFDEQVLPVLNTLVKQIKEFENKKQGVSKQILKFENKGQELPEEIREIMQKLWETQKEMRNRNKPQQEMNVVELTNKENNEVNEKKVPIGNSIFSPIDNENITSNAGNNNENKSNEKTPIVLNYGSFPDN